ncbi:WD40 repeat domain-containing serine/threonine protein kinase [Polyangium mundeleinium]|uniref:Protein kinase n=1 Tax=Polyangium mundeleinium TaxID=2995306 RepID=A0ABT5EEN9_9BACT|nr:protein kinase [Polyangium mundeleinium]MDC0739728.1 protein kinase [Polyangium mundeleinium]
MPANPPLDRPSIDELEISDAEIASFRNAPPPPPPPATRPALTPASLPLVQRTAYAVSGVFAEGGIGRIMKARDTRLDRTVAIKELLSTDAAEAERFVYEAIITARLQHPSIVPVHEAGRWPTGEPFYAMKLITGKPLGDVMNEAHTLEARLALLPHLLAVADAMAYAHSQRIVHRDLKPANVLVGRFGETVVIDWGLAKDLNDDFAEPLSGKPRPLASEEKSVSRSAHLTSVGAIMGTPAYMPPEQAMAKPVDERADVYAIGALLYRALSGVAPYDVPGGDVIDVALKVLEAPPVPLAERQKGIPEDLLAIVEKAMARDAAKRYPTAKELADDLRRFQMGQFVAAHTYSRGEIVRRFIKRRRTPLLVGLVGVVALSVVGILSLTRIIQERNRAQANEIEAQQQKAEAQAQRLEAQQKQAEATKRADELTISQARGLMERDPSQAIAWLKTLSPNSPRFPAARTLAADALARGIGKVFRAHSGGINAVAVAPDGRTIATASDDRTVRVWDLETGTHKVLSGHGDEVWVAAFSPDGKLLATGGKDKSVRIWDLASGTSRVLAGHEQWVTSIRFSANGQWLTSQGFGDGVFLWNVPAGTGKRVAENTGVELSRGAVFSGDGRTLVLVEKGKLVVWDVATDNSRSFGGQTSVCSSIAVSSDGMFVVTGGVDGSMRLWNTSKGALRTFPGHTKEVTALAFLPNGTAFVSGSKDRAVRYADLSNGATRLLGQYGGEIKTLALSPDGSRVAAVGQDRNVVLWDVGNGQRRTLGGFQDWLGLHGVAFSPDGKRLAAAGFDQTMRVWELGTQIDRVVGEHDGAATTAAFLPDGKRVVSAADDGTVRLFDLASGAPQIVDRHSGKVSDLRVFPDGTAIASAGEDGAVRIASLSGQPPKVLRGHAGRVARIAIAPDGKHLASGGADKKIRLWNVASGQAEVLFEHDKPVETLAFSPDGAVLATGSADKTVRVYRFATKEAKTLGTYERPVRAVAFSPDGKTLASGSADHTIGLWDLATGQGRVIDASGNGVTQIVFFPDGATFASLGSEPSVRLWETATGKPREILRGHGKTVVSISVSSDGKRIASASLDGSARIWDLESHEDRPLAGHAGGVASVAFSPDGRALVSTGQDRTVRLWGDDLPADETGLRAWLDGATKDVVHLDDRPASPEPTR